MSATKPWENDPQDHCPACGREYAYRLPKRYTFRFRVGNFYRHEHGSFVYLHRDPTPPSMGNQSGGATA